MTMQKGQRDFDQTALRSALGSYPTGVTVITTRSTSGADVGITCNSFASLSLVPPLILWSLRNESTNFKHFDQCGHFAVNILTQDQKAICHTFARQAEDKFAGVDTRKGIHGVALIMDALTSFECRKDRQIVAGDHTIFIGEVETFSTIDEADALVFHRGGFV